MNIFCKTKSLIESFCLKSLLKDSIFTFLVHHRRIIKNSLISITISKFKIKFLMLGSYIYSCSSGKLCARAIEKIINMNPSSGWTLQDAFISYNQLHFSPNIKAVSSH